MSHRAASRWVSVAAFGGALTLVVASFQGVSSAAAKSPAAAAAISFGKSKLVGEISTRPTTLQFGPDGRLYVLQQDGTIYIYKVARSAKNSYRVTATQTVLLIKQIPNHDDDGKPDAAFNIRQATGMIVRGTAARPVMYVSSSDPRYGGGPRGDLNLDTNSGMVSKLTWNGTSWTKFDIVRGLPRSEENHSVNGLAINSAGTVLYLAVGGHTNMGAPSHVFADLPEFALSAAVLTIDLTAIGSTTYDLPTLDDPNRPGVNDANDPFGGDNGANQAKIVAGGPVQVYASGFRNPYDLLLSSKGVLYTDDNGHNAGQGDVPIKEGPAGNCTNGINEPGVTGPDSLHVVTKGYYGGHPNPTRGNKANTFNGQSSILAANPIECDYQLAGSAARPVLATDPSSSNGIAEYTASNFGGAMKGDLLLAAYDNYVERVHVDSTGKVNLGKTTLFSSVGVHPLDIVAMGDNEAFPGTIWLVDIGDQNIYVFEPTDFGGGGGGTCTGVYSTTLDEDGDGFTNADEIDNGTDPCSAADAPHDWDGDHISDLNDPNDDNDALPDTSDPFAIDSTNGLNKSMPVSYQFDGSSGGLLDMGFTGLMTNGTSNYASLFDPTKLTAGGAPGVLTIDQLTPGNSTTGNQEYGFQFGVKPGTVPFMAHTRVVSPFAGTTAVPGQYIGLQLGTGTQSDYVKIALTGDSGGGVEVVTEIGGVITTSGVTPLVMPGPDAVELYLETNPIAHTVQPAIRVVTGGVTGARQAIGGPINVPASWLDGHAAVAVGLLGTSPSGHTLSGTWDLLEAVPMGGGTTAQPDETIKLAGDASALGNNIYNTTGAGQTRTVTSARGTSKTFVIEVWNDSASSDSYLIKGAGPSTGFTVKYLKGGSGTTDITAGVLAGTYKTFKLAPASRVVIRLVVTIAASAPPGVTRDWLLTATSTNAASAKDAVDARLTTQ
jgi:glucose/arabinose dehydrogenase